MVYEPGQEVFRSQPFCYVIEFPYRSKYCDFCLQCKFALKKCSHCKFVYYCGKSCQKKGWRTHHQNECYYVKKMLEENVILNLRRLT